MPLQDLTPQLRTRLSRVERAVGLFVLIAVVLLLIGFCYYISNVAERRGWFVNKVPYFTLLFNASGLKEGDPIKMMGYEAGKITEIKPMPPDQYYSIYVQFHVRDPYYGYLWKDSKAKVAAADFLGKRSIELTKGTQGPATVVETNKTTIGKSRKVPWGILDDNSDSQTPRYLELKKGAKGYFLPPDESPAVTEKLEQVMRAVEVAFPNLTNALGAVLRNSTMLTSNLNALVANAQPIITNVTVITDHLREPKGSLGEWLIPTNINAQLAVTLTNASDTLVTARTNVEAIAASLNRSLINLAELTGNLNSQVQANGTILTEISTLIVNVDEMVQGLKRHWLLRSAFKGATNAPVESILQPSVDRPK
jgi:ABC-type transporter Mla subunit MlaD